MTKAKVTSKGQITLPKRVRTRLGLAPGDAVEFVEEGGEFRLRRHVGNSPFAPYRRHLSSLRGRDPDEIVEELRAHPSPPPATRTSSSTS